MGKKSYSNLTPKEKKEHLALLEGAVMRAKQNLEYWQSCLTTLKGEMK